MGTPPEGVLMESMVGRLRKLEDQGYTINFSVSESGRLLSGDSEALPDSQVDVDSVYRIEDDSAPTSQAVIYAISLASGKKGVLVDSYGAQSDPAKDKFINHHLRKGPKA